MGDEEKYKMLREQYRTYKTRVLTANYNAQVEGLAQAKQEIPKLEEQLLEFCLSNGYDLQELQKFYREVDYDALGAGYTAG